MSKHQLGRHLWRQRQTASAPQATTDAKVRAVYAPLTSEGCQQLADQLTTIEHSAGELVHALHRLAAAGGEAEAPALVRGQAYRALVQFAEALQGAPDVIARVVQGRAV
jgi:hypothetical protein